ncbi:MAG: Ig-like domain-containing protein [Bifidobacteriaceae bacterium]|jgi:uncharacterized protein YjdB|nr:Ig-like domain-containing protein [Bifidobacteriaceae bacterium]
MITQALARSAATLALVIALLPGLTPACADDPINSSPDPLTSNNIEVLARLKALHTKALRLDPTQYSQDSWLSLVSALDQAEAALAGKGSTHHALTVLQTAWNGLVVLSGLPNSGIGQPVIGGQPSQPAVTDYNNRQVLAVTVAQNTVNLRKHQTISIPGFGYTAHNQRVNLIWKSANRKIASVNARGQIKAHRKGHTRITAQTVEGLKAHIKVRVFAKQPRHAKASRLIVKGLPANHQLLLNRPVYLTATVLPNTAIGVQVTYRSSHPLVVEAGPAGRLWAHSAGSAVITVSTGKVQTKLSVIVP